MKSRSAMICMIFLLGVGNSALGQVRTLETKSFTVTIDRRCPEDWVVCNEIKYEGKSKKTGKTIILWGRTIHSTCKDGTPCTFWGYEFMSGKITYNVWDSGYLLVTKQNKTLINEKGVWVAE